MADRTRVTSLMPSQDNRGQEERQILELNRTRAVADPLPHPKSRRRRPPKCSLGTTWRLMAFLSEYLRTSERFRSKSSCKDMRTEHGPHGQPLRLPGHGAPGVSLSTKEW